MEETLVSIIMPCHNGEKYISEAIESVLAQTYTNWELLIINDNSIDNSINVIKSYCKQNTRIKYFDNKNPTGFPASPRNIGIKNANGRYIAFLDCDDKWLPSKLEKQLKLFENDNCTIAFSFYKKMNENGYIHDKIINSPHKVSYKNLLNGNCIGNLTGMYDTRKVGKIFQKEIHHEDYVMWLEILKHGYFAINTDTVEAIYRESCNSVSGSKLKVFFWTWNIYWKDLKLSFIESIWHFLIYAIKGSLKLIK